MKESMKEEGSMFYIPWEIRRQEETEEEGRDVCVIHSRHTHRWHHLLNSICRSKRMTDWMLHVMMDLLFAAPSCSCLSKSFGKRIVVNLQFGDLLILISSDCDEFRLSKHICPEGWVGKFEEIIGSDQMKTRLILVHGIQDCKAMFVCNVIGQLQFMKRDNLLHPLLSCRRRVRMNVHPLGHLRICFSCHHPPRVMKLVSTIISSHDIHQHDVLSFLVQSWDSNLEGRKHPPVIEIMEPNEWMGRRRRNTRSIRKGVWEQNRIISPSCIIKMFQETQVFFKRQVSCKESG